MQISRSLKVDAPIKSVWKTLVDDFVPVHEWMASIKSSTPRSGPVLPGAPAAGRDAAIGAGAPGTIMEETFTALDRAQGLIEFDTILNAPSFNPIKGWSNQIKLSEQGEATLVTWSIQVRFRLIGNLMRIPIKKSLKAGFTRSLEEVAHMLETGQPHARKIKQFEKESEISGLANVSA